MSETKQKVYLTGIGMGNTDTQTIQAESVFQNCDCIIGAQRMLDTVSHLQKPRFVAYHANQVKQFLESNPQYHTVAVALSGDTGFYSGAKKFKEQLTNCEVEFIPGISSVVYLAARLGISWDDAALISIHGRAQNFIYAVSRNEKTFLLTGAVESGKEICEKIQHYQLQNIEVYIGQALSYPEERIIHKRGGQLQPEDFQGLVTAMIYNPDPDSCVSPHLSDDAFLRGRVPMTKEEVRVVCLGKLSLTRDAVLYDVGAGTGSVSVEAARHAGSIQVFAIEKKPDAVELLNQNKQKFCCDNIEVVQGNAPEVLQDLPAPTHVFVGGSSGNLKEILRLVQKKNPQVRIVLTAISLETLKEAVEAMEEGLLPEADIVQIMAARAKTLGAYHMMTGCNPVSIISAGGLAEEKVEA